MYAAAGPVQLSCSSVSVVNQYARDHGESPLFFLSLRRWNVTERFFEGQIISCLLLSFQSVSTET